MTPPTRMSRYFLRTLREAPAEASEAPPVKEYLLQAASFPRRKEAEVLRAQLMLEGLRTAVNAVRRPNGDTWHRVMVGPFAEKAEMQRMLTRLRAKDIAALPIARRAERRGERGERGER